MPLTVELKEEIIRYNLAKGSFSKGLIEDDGPVAVAYEKEEITADDICDFIDECREFLLSHIKENK